MKFGRDSESTLAKGGQSPREIITSELDQGENLIWVDTPIFLINHAKIAIPFMFFGIPFTAFSIFWIYGAMQTGPSGGDFGIIQYAFPMFGVPFVLLGLSMLLSPIWQMLKARYIIYALTDKRLIIREGMPIINIRSWPLKDISKISRNGAAGVPGDLFFGEEISRSSKGRHTTKKIGFIGISEPKRLEEEIRSRIDRS